MLRLAWGRRDSREVRGQIGRIIGAALLVPDGNTGGANVSAFKRMEIAPDLRRLLDGEHKP